MSNLLDYPLPFFLLSFVVLWLSARAGVYIRQRRQELEQAEHEDLGVIGPDSPRSISLPGDQVNPRGTVMILKLESQKPLDAVERGLEATAQKRVF
jgi:hypothetical protein